MPIDPWSSAEHKDYCPGSSLKKLLQLFQSGLLLIHADPHLELFRLRRWAGNILPRYQAHLAEVHYYNPEFAPH